MNRRGTGAAFCFMATLLLCTRYICAAIFGAGVSSWSRGLYSNMLAYVGSSLKVLSIIMATVGVIYLILAEISDK